MSEINSTLNDIPELQTAELPRERNTPDMINFLRVAATMFVFLLHGLGRIDGIDGTSKLSFLGHFPAWAGVWILFFISGYLMEKGFLSKKYVVFSGGWKQSIMQLLKFCGKRFLRIAPAYYLYILLFEVLRADALLFSSPLTLLKLLTFSYNGFDGAAGIGHLWYISTAMWLYVLAPFLDFVIGKIKWTWLLVALFCAVAGCGFGLRWGLYGRFGSDHYLWYTYVYTLVPANIDLFLCGMLACALISKLSVIKFNKWLSIILKVVSVSAFISLTIYNCYIYSYIDCKPMDDVFLRYLTIYRYVLPTFWLLSAALILLAFDRERAVRSKVTLKVVARNPLRLIDAFAPYTYEFYIFHIMVFAHLDNCFRQSQTYVEMPAAARYFIFFICSFLLTLLIAVLYHKMLGAFRFNIKKKPQSLAEKK